MTSLSSPIEAVLNASSLLAPLPKQRQLRVSSTGAHGDTDDIETIHLPKTSSGLGLSPTEADIDTDGTLTIHCKIHAQEWDNPVNSIQTCHTRWSKVIKSREDQLATVA